MDRSIWEKLIAAKIHHVTVEYYGSGDSGDIEDATFHDASETRIDVPAALDSEVRDHAHDVLRDNVPGWEINEGSYGTLTYHTEEKQVEADHYYNVTSTEPAPFTAS